jgi:NAD(P)H-flavin reductase
MSTNKFVSVVKIVRENKNNYPYITFVNGANEAQNVYFSKTAAKTVAQGQEIAKGFFAPFIATEVTYTDGRPTQWKISTKGESLRAPTEELF